MAHLPENFLKIHVCRCGATIKRKYCKCFLSDCCRNEKYVFFKNVRTCFWTDFLYVTIFQNFRALCDVILIVVAQNNCKMYVCCKIQYKI